MAEAAITVKISTNKHAECCHLISRAKAQRAQRNAGLGGKWGAEKREHVFMPAIFLPEYFCLRFAQLRAYYCLFLGTSKHE